MLAVVSVAPDALPENPVFKELVEKGIAMSDGTTVKLPPPILPDGLDAAGQKAAIDKAAGPKTNFAELIKKSFYTPVVVKVRTPNATEGEGPAVRTIDVWFVAHGNWNTLTSKDFLETALKGKEEGANRVVIRSGFLSDKELDARKLNAHGEREL